MKLNKNGFTLVEVIVVLVILAILAAILIPSLTGYIDKANEKVSIAECRSAVLAAQTIASEAYGERTTFDGTHTTAADPDGVVADTIGLAEVAAGSVTSIIIAGNKVTDLTYVTADWTCKYEDGVFTVTPTV